MDKPKSQLPGSLQRMVRPREEMLAAIEHAQAEYAAIFESRRPEVDEMSDIGWLGLVAVPWLLARERNRKEDSGDGNADGDPRADGIRPPQPPLKLMLAEQSHAKAPDLVVAGNPLAKLLVALLAKVVGVSIYIHGAKWPNDPSSATRPARRFDCNRDAHAGFAAAPG